MFGRKKKKGSFFEKLTGTMPADDFDDFDFEEEDHHRHHAHKRQSHGQEEDPRHMHGNHDFQESSEQSHIEETPHEEPEGQLSVDVINTPDAIVIKSMLAGVKPSDIDVDITRDMITIRGTREESHEVERQDYYHRELYWGSFSRNILLPEEIDVDAAEAAEKHGLLTLTLPKLDKNRQTKIHVKSK